MEHSNSEQFGLVVVGGFVLGYFVHLGVLEVIVTVVVLGFFIILSCPFLLSYCLFMLDSENWILFSLKNLEVIILGIPEWMNW